MMHDIMPYIFSLESISSLALQSHAQLFDVHLNTSCKILQSKTGEQPANIT